MKHYLQKFNQFFSVHKTCCTLDFESESIYDDFSVQILIHVQYSLWKYVKFVCKSFHKQYFWYFRLWFFLNDRSIYNQPWNFESTTNFVYKFIWTMNNLNINTGFNAQRVGLGLSADWIPLFPVWHYQHETCSSSPCLDSSSRFAAPRSRCWDTPSRSPYWFYLA